ncbi:MAG: hypothetical protein AB1665_09215, partial [Candidatus Thermoplasmatota archaeon]
EARRRLEGERERLRRKVFYREVEYTKYYIYPKAGVKVPRWDQRKFEARASITIRSDVDPEDLEGLVEERFDEIMETLGMRTYGFDKSFSKAGYRVLAPARAFRETSDVVVTDPQRGYVWDTYPDYKEVPLELRGKRITITITREEQRRVVK